MRFRTVLDRIYFVLVLNSNQSAYKLKSRTFKGFIFLSFFNIGGDNSLNSIAFGLTLWNFMTTMKIWRLCGMEPGLQQWQLNEISTMLQALIKKSIRQFFYSHHHSPGLHPYLSTRWTGQTRLTNSHGASFHKAGWRDAPLALRDLASWAICTLSSWERLFKIRLNSVMVGRLSFFLIHSYGNGFVIAMPYWLFSPIFTILDEIFFCLLSTINVQIKQNFFVLFIL